jgi:hypothetical protein
MKPAMRTLVRDCNQWLRELRKERAGRRALLRKEYKRGVRETNRKVAAARQLAEHPTRAELERRGFTVRSCAVSKLCERAEQMAALVDLLQLAKHPFPNGDGDASCTLQVQERLQRASALAVSELNWLQALSEMTPKQNGLKPTKAGTRSGGGR